MGSGDTLQALLKARADPDARCSMALERAQAWEASVPENVQPRFSQAAGCTAVHFALRFGNEGMVEQLLDAGAQHNYLWSEGYFIPRNWRCGVLVEPSIPGLGSGIGKWSLEFRYAKFTEI